MNRKFLVILVAICILSGCAGSKPIVVPEKKPRPLSEWLVQEQSIILDSSQEYVNCLDRTRTIKGDFETFDAAVDQCIKEVNGRIMSRQERNKINQ